MAPTRIVQLCKTKKCYRLARFHSKVLGGYVCGRCADPEAVTIGYGAAAGKPEQLTPVSPHAGAWEAA